MILKVRKPEHIVPSYSLTGDLLSYSRCSLQYRYYNGSSLPPSRPVQRWFGEFLHETVELAYRFWSQNANVYPFPWPCNVRAWGGESEPNWAPNDIGYFGDLVEKSLRVRGKQARSTRTRESAYRRVESVINKLGPHLFSLIVSAEQKVIGTRFVPTSEVQLRCSSYEVHGVIDVLTSMKLGEVNSDNLIKQAVQQYCPGLNGEFEVLVDYKGAHRPNTDDPYWTQEAWQIQTYAWLRQRQVNSTRVAAGILIYANELTPGSQEMTNLKNGIKQKTTDVLPEDDSSDAQIVRMWGQGYTADQLSGEFTLRRAVRVVPITKNSTAEALVEFDKVVREIEQNIVQETMFGRILDAWKPNCNDEKTCNACDFRYHCPKPAGANENYIPRAPVAP